MGMGAAGAPDYHNCGLEGCDNEIPERAATVAPFYLDVFEVTVGRCDAEGTAQGGRTTTDDDGVATWRRLVPGRYTLWIDAGVDDGELEIELRPGRNEAEVRVE